VTRKKNTNRVCGDALLILVMSPLSVTVEHLFGLIDTASHLDIQKIRIIGFLFQNRLRWQIEGEKSF
jgi:hypothetical protein